MLRNYYFTFGCGTENGRKYVLIKAEGLGDARALMFSQFGEHWAFCAYLRQKNIDTSY